MTTTTSNKLEVTVASSDANGACLKLTGVIDERFEANKLFEKVTPITVCDLEGIKRITSFGVRQWSEAMKTLPSSVKHLYLVRCPPSFVDQLNMVLNFGGRAEIVTATAVYFCEACQEERQVPIDVFANRSQISSGQGVPANCPQCQGPLQLEEDPQQYFRFAATYGAKAIEPQAAAILQANKLYQVKSGGGRPPQEVKLVSGDVTLFKISGTLDQRFRPRRLASGVEGHVVFDLADVEGVDDTGAKSWRKLLEALTGATTISLVEVPQALLAPIAGGRFSVDKTVLHSVRVPFRCSACSTELLAPLKPSEFPNVQPRACARCGKPSPLAMGTNVLEIAFGIAKKVAGQAPPASVEQVIGQRAELLSRAMAEAGSGNRQGDGDGGLSRYRVIRPLSQGGMAEILLAVHHGIGGFEKLIALKKIRREMLERKQIAIELFLNEAKIAANLNHPNIVQIFEIGQHGGDLFIAMEYVHGVDARDIIRTSRSKQQPLTLEQILFVGTQVAAALHHAHTAKDLSGKNLNIVHRDVSLSNIVVGYDGQVKLVDFGVATASAVGASPEGLIGKVSYMSPEQIRSQGLDGRSDLFSLGIVLYELIAGQPLFRRDTDERTLIAVLTEPIPSLAQYGVPSFVEQVLLQALARDRDKRFANGRAFELALEECLQKLKSTVNNHQLSVYMKQLFGEKAAIPPTANPDEASEDAPMIEIGDIAEDSKSESSDSSKSYHVSEMPWEGQDARTIVEAENKLVKGVVTSPTVPSLAASAAVSQAATTASETSAAASGGAARPSTSAAPAAVAAAASNAPAKTGKLSLPVIVFLVAIALLVVAGILYSKLT